VLDFDSRVCLKDVENLHFGLDWGESLFLICVADEGWDEIGV